MMKGVLCLMMIGQGWLTVVVLGRKLLCLIMTGLGWQTATAVVIGYTVLCLVMIGQGWLTALVLGHEMACQLAVVNLGHISVDYTLISYSWCAAIHLSLAYYIHHVVWECCIDCDKIVVAIAVDRLIPGNSADAQD